MDLGLIHLEVVFQVVVCECGVSEGSFRSHLLNGIYNTALPSVGGGPYNATHIMSYGHGSTVDLVRHVLFTGRVGFLSVRLQKQKQKRYDTIRLQFETKRDSTMCL